MLRFAAGELPDRQLHIFVGHAPDFVPRCRKILNRSSRLPVIRTVGKFSCVCRRLLTLSTLPRKYADYYGPYGPGVLSVSRGLGRNATTLPASVFSALLKSRNHSPGAKG